MSDDFASLQRQARNDAGKYLAMIMEDSEIASFVKSYAKLTGRDIFGTPPDQLGNISEIKRQGAQAIWLKFQKKAKSMPAWQKWREALEVAAALEDGDDGAIEYNTSQPTVPPRPANVPVPHVEEEREMVMFDDEDDDDFVPPAKEPIETAISDDDEDDFAVDHSPVQTVTRNTQSEIFEADEPEPEPSPSLEKFAGNEVAGNDMADDDIDEIPEPPIQKKPEPVKKADPPKENDPFANTADSYDYDDDDDIDLSSPPVKKASAEQPKSAGRHDDTEGTMTTPADMEKYKEARGRMDAERLAEEKDAQARKGDALQDVEDETDEEVFYHAGKRVSKEEYERLTREEMASVAGDGTHNPLEDTSDNGDSLFSENEPMAEEPPVVPEPPQMEEPFAEEPPTSEPAKSEPQPEPSQEEVDAEMDALFAKNSGMGAPKINAPAGEDINDFLKDELPEPDMMEKMVDFDNTFNNKIPDRDAEKMMAAANEPDEDPEEQVDEESKGLFSVFNKIGGSIFKKKQDTHF